MLNNILNIGRGSSNAEAGIQNSLANSSTNLANQQAIANRATAFRGQMGEASQQLTENTLTEQFLQKRQEAANNLAKSAIQNIVTS